MDTTQLLTNPAMHWYPANIYHKTFHGPPRVNDDGYTHKSPAPTTTNVCSSCGQSIVVVESDQQPDNTLYARQQIVAGVIIAVVMIVLFVVGANKLFNE